VVSFWAVDQPDLQIMKLVFKQFVALLLGFGLMWGALSAIRWTQWLRIEENTQATEDKIGDLLWEQMNHTETVLLQPGVTKPMADGIVPFLFLHSTTTYCHS